MEEFRASGLDLDRLGGNSGKNRLSLDLASLLPREGRLKVLDVGCAGPLPMNLWAPFLPLADRLELHGVDVANLDRARSAAADIGIEIDIREGSATDLVSPLGTEQFDAVVCTQVLEHVPDWRRALEEMRGVLRPGGTLLLTCDAMELAKSPATRLKLEGKRRWSQIRERHPALAKAGDRLVSGEWEKGLTRDEVRAGCVAAALTVETLLPYGLRDIKLVQRPLGGYARQLWLSFEEAAHAEGGDALRVDLFTLLYVRARRD